MERKNDFEQELYNAFGQVKDFTLGMRIAKYFYDMGVNAVLEDIKALLPVSQIHSYHEVYDDIVGLVRQLKGEQQ